jgi:hypothetical protein
MHEVINNKNLGMNAKGISTLMYNVALKGLKSQELNAIVEK